MDDLKEEKVRQGRGEGRKKDEQDGCREAGRATFHEMLKQQHGCQSNFTPRWFHTSAIALLDQDVRSLFCVFIYLVSVSMDVKSQNRGLF